ncbi:F0F1 ATP synthase subunit gamma [Candidatus Omnitrophota bacterium]
MLSLVNLQKDRKSLSELHGVIEVLKGFSIMQLKTLQRHSWDTVFSDNLEDSFRILNLKYVIHPFLKDDPDLPKAIVVVTSDEGFSGELNTLLIEEAQMRWKLKDELIVLGERGINFLRSREQEFVEFKRAKEKELTHADARNLTAYLTRNFLDKLFGRVDVIYPRFISLTKQIVVTQRILPFHPQKAIKKKAAVPRGALIEPGISSLVDILVRLWLMQVIYEIFREAQLAQTAARILQLAQGVVDVLVKHTAQHIDNQY